MQHRLPVCARNLRISNTLAVGAFAVFAIALVGGVKGSLADSAFIPASTLDAQISSVGLQWKSPILEFVDNCVLQVSSQETVSEPRLVAPQNFPEGSSSAAKVGPSPFQNWIAPHSSDQEVGAATVIISDQAEVPEVARRILPRRQPAPIPQSQPQRERSDGTSGRSSDQSDTLVIDEEDVQDPADGDLPAFVDEPNPLDEEEPSDNRAKVNLPPLTPQQRALRTKVRRVLTHHYNRPLNTRDRSPWELMHGMLAYEVHSKFLQGGPNGQPITAVGWLCYNQAGRRRTLMYVNDDGELRVRVGPALQGHRGQFLALLAQCKVKSDYPMLVDGHELTIKDLIEMEMKTCYPNTELTFKLIGLMHYLDSDTQWVNEQGMSWSLPRLVSEEVRQPVRGAACGGTHRLSGLTLAYKTRIKRGEPVDGEYLRAQRVVAQHMQYAYRLQNPDGSFSTEWFNGRGNRNDVDRKLQTTGHILEWLLYAVNEKELHDPRTTRAVNYLATILQNEPQRDWDAGPLGHALHALFLYDRLAYSKYDDDHPVPVAVRNSRIYQARR